MHCQLLEIPGASVFGTAAWEVKLAQQAKHSILLLKQKKKKKDPTNTHRGTVNVAGLANYLHVPELQACDFLQPLLFTGVIFALFFFFRVAKKNLSLLPISCLVLDPQLKGLCDLESPTDVARGTAIASLSIPSGDVDLQTHFKRFSLRLSGWLYLKALLTAL